MYLDGPPQNSGRKLLLRGPAAVYQQGVAGGAGLLTKQVGSRDNVDQTEIHARKGFIMAGAPEKLLKA